MIQYIYVLKCPDCEDEFFDFFDEAKACALGCLSNRPIITQTEVNRNDFGECTDHCDLGTVWSWEDAVGKETTAEPTVSVFNKGDFKQYAGGVDPEFDSIDNSVDFEIDETADNLNEFIDSHGNKISINANRVAATPQQQGSIPQNSAISLDQLAPQLGMFDTNVSLNFGSKMVKIPFSKEKMAYGDSFVYKDIFTRATGSVLKEIVNKTGVKLNRDYGNNMLIWTYNNDNNIILVHIPGFNFIIDKNDLIAQLGGQTSAGSTNTRQNVTSALKALNSSDFQNRNGNYPRSGIPDTIYASDTDISFSFKNTNQSAAERWVRNYLSQNGFTVAPENVKSYQSGDYDDDWVEVSVNIKNISFTSNESCSRKLIPEGMTIEELVEAMEENEDTVECTKCGGLFEKAECHHNKEGFGWCCTNCEPADTLVEDTQEEYDLATLVKDSINHLVNDLGKDCWADDFPDEVIADLENNYDIYVPDDMDSYNSWCSVVASEVSRQVNNPESTSFVEELEEPDTYRKRLGLCPECGADQAFDQETGFCIECGFNFEGI